MESKKQELLQELIKELKFAHKLVYILKENYEVDFNSKTAMSVSKSEVEEMLGKFEDADKDFYQISGILLYEIKLINLELKEIYKAVRSDVSETYFSFIRSNAEVFAEDVLKRILTDQIISFNSF
jgi:hypothetical protein